MKRLSQTLTVTLALFVAAFANGVFPVGTAYALEAITSEAQQPETVESPTEITEQAQQPLEQSNLESTEVPVTSEQPVLPAIDNSTDDLESSLGSQPTFAARTQPTISDPMPQPDAIQTCDDLVTPGSGGWTVKYSAGYPDTVLYTAPSGYLVDQYCVKSGSTQQGNGPKLITVSPASSVVTIDYPGINSISHYVVHLIVDPSPPQTPVSPLAPQITDSCGIVNDVFTLPSDSSQITYSKVGNIVTATLVMPATYDFGAPLNGYVIANDGLTATYTVVFTNTECPTCPANTSWVDMNDNKQVDEGECYKKVFVCKYVGTPGINERLQTGNNPISVSVNAIPNFEGVGSYFADAQGRSYVLALDEGQAQPDVSQCPRHDVIPAEPQLTDLCYSDNDWLYITETSHVTYYMGGTKITSSPVKVTGNFVITAVADRGYYFADGVPYKWEFSATNKQCITISKSPVAYVDTNNNGVVDLGDVVTWTVTLTNTDDDAYEYGNNFYLMVSDEGATFDEEETSGVLSPGESVTLHVTKPLTATDVSACKAVNNASFSAWRIMYDERVSLLDNEEMDPLATGSADASLTLNCGRVLGTSTTTAPKVLAATTLPAELPATGGESNGYLLLGIVVSAMTYFVVLRRQHA